MPANLASILNLMGPDMMVILLIVLLLFGSKKLPELARGVGRAVKEFSAARDEIGKDLKDAATLTGSNPKSERPQIETSDRCEAPNE